MWDDALSSHWTHFMTPRHSTFVLWAIFGLLLMFISVWPYWAGMIVMNDDMKFVRSLASELPVWEQLRLAWTSSPSFRPLEIIVGRLSDPVSLACPWVMPLQLAGLGVLTLGVVRVAIVIMPGERLLAPVALIMIFLSPATTCSVWQMDSCSQTWSAALGVWCCVFAWTGFEHAGRGTWPWRDTAWLTLLFAISVNIKETAYGWSLGIGTCSLVASGWRLVCERSAAVRTLPLLAACIGLPLAHLVMRLLVGAVDQSLEGDEDSRYYLQVGMNLVINMLMSMGGAFATGPFYLMANPQAWLPVKAMAVVASLLQALVLATAIEFAFLQGNASLRRGCRLAAIFCTATLGSVSITCLMQSVSELYGFGANVGFAMLIAVGFVATIRSFEQLEASKWIPRLATGAMFMAALIGVYGMAGRSGHFAITWRLVRQNDASLIQAAQAIQQRAEANPSTAHRNTGSAGLGGEQLTVCFRPECRPHYAYGQYVNPVQQGMDILCSLAWLKRKYPAVEPVLRMDTDCSQLGGAVFAADCTGVASHGNW